jgi:hypothetical protein
MFVLETCLKCDPKMLKNSLKCDRQTWILKLGNTACLFLKRAWNVIRTCLKCDPNMLEMWSKHAPELQFLKVGNTACSFLKYDPNMLQNCFKCDRHTWILKLGNTACSFLKRAWNVIQTCLKCAWNVIQTCLKCDPNMLQNCNLLIDTIFRGCVSSTGIFPADPKKTILPGNLCKKPLLDCLSLSDPICGKNERNRGKKMQLVLSDRTKGEEWTWLPKEIIESILVKEGFSQFYTDVVNRRGGIFRPRS